MSVDVSKIKAGDWVRVEAGHGATVEGPARTVGNPCGNLFVGPVVIRFNGGGTTCCKVLEHKPKRMDEPGYGQHVKSNGMEFVRTGDPSFAEEPREWAAVATGARLRWNQIIDPQPVHPF